MKKLWMLLIAVFVVFIFHTRLGRNRDIPAGSAYSARGRDDRWDRIGSRGTDNGWPECLAGNGRNAVGLDLGTRLVCRTGLDG